MINRKWEETEKTDNKIKTLSNGEHHWIEDMSRSCIGLQCYNYKTDSVLLESDWPQPGEFPIYCLFYFLHHNITLPSTTRCLAATMQMLTMVVPLLTLWFSRSPCRPRWCLHPLMRRIGWCFGHEYWLPVVSAFEYAITLECITFCLTIFIPAIFYL